MMRHVSGLVRVCFYELSLSVTCETGGEAAYTQHLVSEVG